MFRTEIWWVLAVAATAGLYVSSVNRGTLRALVMMIGVVIVLAIGIQLAERPVVRIANGTTRLFVQPLYAGWHTNRTIGRALREWIPIAQGALLASRCSGSPCGIIAHSSAARR